jgi:hypothetical protein
MHFVGSCPMAFHIVYNTVSWEKYLISEGQIILDSIIVCTRWQSAVANSSHTERAAHSSERWYNTSICLMWCYFLQVMTRWTLISKLDSELLEGYLQAYNLNVGVSTRSVDVRFQAKNSSPIRNRSIWVTQTLARVYGGGDRLRWAPASQVTFRILGTLIPISPDCLQRLHYNQTHIYYQYSLTYSSKIVTLSFISHP